jgi:hypothetical protein
MIWRAPQLNSMGHIHARASREPLELSLELGAKMAKKDEDFVFVSKEVKVGCESTYGRQNKDGQCG